MKKRLLYLAFAVLLVGNSSTALAEETSLGIFSEEKQTDTSSLENKARWCVDIQGWRYLKADGTFCSSEKLDIGGKIYYFEENGYMVTGWQKLDGAWYYFKENGAMAFGWILYGGKWYYLNDDGKMATNWVEVNGQSYYLDKDGKMMTGWVRNDGSWFYLNANGAKATGWQMVSGKWYYLDPKNEGRMVSDGRYEISGQFYSFNQKGEMMTGWIRNDGSWFYLNANGAKTTGWQMSSGKWYYLDPKNEGRMVSDGWHEISGHSYYFNQKGEMLTGWVWSEGWYYLGTDGAKKYGWVMTDKKWYYLDANNENAPGKMVADFWKEIGGKWYSFKASGEMRVGWLDASGGWYYLGEDGAMKTGWQIIGSYWYYLYEENDTHGGKWGQMAADTQIDGWVIRKDGIHSAAVQQAYNVLNKVGWDLYAAFNWSAGLTYQTNTANASPGSDWFATYGFNNQKGNCYVMAATFYYMADLLDYDVHQISGYVALQNGRLSPHSWCEIVIDGTAYVFDPDFKNETGRNGYMIRYGASGTWKYSQYYRMN